MNDLYLKKDILKEMFHIKTFMNKPMTTLNSFSHLFISFSILLDFISNSIQSLVDLLFFSLNV